mgnify:CR=1 FL=1
MKDWTIRKTQGFQFICTLSQTKHENREHMKKHATHWTDCSSLPWFLSYSEISSHQVITVMAVTGTQSTVGYCGWWYNLARLLTSSSPLVASLPDDFRRLSALLSRSPSLDRESLLLDDDESPPDNTFFTHESLSGCDKQ